MALKMASTDTTGRESPEAYHRVEISGAADRLRIDVTIWHDRAARAEGREPVGRIVREFRPDLASPRNFVAQAYDVLKSDAYAGAEDA